jgi:phosphopantothenoylcysteine decarboxylase/phosphopantothenate--cysteine ligase
MSSLTCPTNESGSPLSGKFICLGVSGAIAAYKAADLCSKLFRKGAEVQVIMTNSALRFVGELTFETLSHKPVITQLWSRSAEWDPQHVALARKTDVVIIAPATANIIAKMAHGIADDALSTALLTFTCPVIIAPAMNTRMWKHPATQANIKTLQERGVLIIGPDSGPLACRDVEGPGRMSEPAEILAFLESRIAGKDA